MRSQTYPFCLFLLFLIAFARNSFGQITLSPQIALSFAKSSTWPSKRTFALAATITLTVTSTNSTCKSNNGTIIATATGGTAPYKYSLDNGREANNGYFPFMLPGTYILTVTDALGETAAKTVTVANTFDPPILLAPNYKSVTGCLNANGSVTFSPLGGTPPYQYTLDGINWQTNNVFSNLYAGYYKFDIKDANGCTDEYTTFDADFLLGPNCHPELNFGGTLVVCTNEGHFSHESSTSYLYSMDGINFQPTLDVKDLTAGVYPIYSKNTLTGEIFLFAFSVRQGCYLKSDHATSPASCGQNNGTLTINATLGTLPYTYTIDGINFQTSNVFTGLTPGNYNYLVRDFEGFMSSGTATVKDRCLEITAAESDETCLTRNDGTITVTASNGTEPYLYSIDGINFQPGNTFGGLAAGSYIITVKDALGFIKTTILTINLSCLTVTTTATNAACGKRNGSVTVTATNGTPPYQYSLDGINYQTSNLFTNLDAITYTVQIKDANGLNANTVVTITDLPGPAINSNIIAATCSNNDGQITITGSGGTAPYTYSLDGNNFQSNNLFAGIINGNHTATVKDANGCIATLATNVPLTNNLNLQTGPGKNICEGKSANLSITSNATDIKWTPPTGLSNDHISNPIASPTITTRYQITASTGPCILSDFLTVTVITAPIPNAGNSVEICYGKNAQLNGSGGSTYQWSPSTFLNDPTVPNPIITKPSTSITYILKVKDGNGCESLQSSSVKVTITPPPKVFAGNDTSIVINQPFQLTALDVNNSGFVRYSWSPAYGLNNSLVNDPVTILDQDMIYRVTAITQNDCEGTDEIKIKVYKGPEIYVPSAFTPGNDGKNDILKAVPVGIKNFRFFIVYNRWGNQVFYTTDSNKGWDGKLLGIVQSTGVYVWTAEGIDEKGQVIKRKGTVTLIQ